MKVDTLNSQIDGNGPIKGKNTNIVANPNLTGPDILIQGTNQSRVQTSNTPAVKVTKKTQQALDYYTLNNNCNCNK